MNSYVELSVVIITYNEEKEIKKCIDSIISVLNGKVKYEIVLVDSSSTDGTIKLAKKYPIKIARLTNYKSPSAGRYVGYKISQGKYLLFIDGDMNLITKNPNMFLNKLSSLQYAGVQGYILENDYKDDYKKINTKKEKEVFILPGAAFFRRDALDMVGGINPFLHSNEERELSYRLLEKGYKLLFVNQPMVLHWRRHNSNSLREIQRRWNNKYFFGFGEVLRASIRSPFCFFKHIKYYAIYWGFLLLFLSLIWSIITLNVTLVFAIIIFYSIILLRYIIKGEIIQVFTKYIIILGIFIGILKRFGVREIKYEIMKDVQVLEPLFNKIEEVII